MLGHNQKSISKIFTTQITSVSDDPMAVKLQERISEMTTELYESYKTHVSDLNLLSQDSTNSRMLYKSELNRLVSENFEKQKLIRNLKNEIESLFGGECPSLESLLRHQSNTTNPEQERLEIELDQVLKDLDYAESEQNCVKNMLRDEKETILVMKERLQNLNEAHRKITKSYSMAVFSSKKAWNNLILVNNQISSLKKEMKKHKTEYETSVAMKKNFKSENDKEINLLIKSMSYNSLISSDKKRKNQEFKRILKDKIKLYEDNQIIKQNYLKNLSEVKDQIQKISEVIKASGLSEAKSLDKNDAEIIIQAYIQLKYQESSLSSRSQTLTAECLEKKQEFERYDFKFKKLKEENKDTLNTETIKGQTFNLLKEQIENNIKLRSKNEETIVLEESILKAYLDVLNVGSVVMKFMVLLKDHVDIKNSDFQQYIISSDQALGPLKRGFYSKREIYGSLYGKNARKASQKPFEATDQNSEYYNRQILPFFSLTSTEITSAYCNIFGSHEDSEKLARFIKKQPILYSYLTPDMLAEYLKKCKKTQDVYLNANKLMSLSHKEFQNQYVKLVTVILDTLIKIKTQTDTEIQNIKGKCSGYDPNDPNFLNNLMKAPRRRGFKFPTIIKDRVKDPPPASEDNKEVAMLKTFEVTTKGNKKDRNFDELGELKTSKNEKIASLESPQAVLKEVLSIQGKIKSIKSKERRAEIKDPRYDNDYANILKQPWSARVIRSKTQDKGIRKKFLIEIPTPKTKPFSIKL
ncbi:hypothetical protein SteCoe_38124 [Stentor coeruleus]|uniref:Uncharacterized protein n=1 Tax=Stentor coeruleus TaxID=5963 RepID=A0A1R2ALT9_9CILI|nr:hypothetical protein SteCoe_38124 [Stentor coeruleus]